MSNAAADIRRQFIDYFVQKRGHLFVPSSPVVPHDDPTLMFANAGMNQFKPIFLGTADRNSEFGRMTRAANTQKCIRAGGKHNDLDDVGHDTYHHTFFEMLGNWSFGDYFKKEAILWAWELLTQVWGIDKTRLHATYFQGDPAEGLEPDREAAELWRSVTDINPAHIHPGNKKDNFWEMGDTGPCGPCSEIHIDLTPDRSGGALVNKGDARVMEIWNLVFIQFNRGADGKLAPLPARHVDTGMGFERICAVIEGMRTGRIGRVSNYDTDVFKPIFAAIQRVTGAPEYTGLLETDISATVISDSGSVFPSRDREGADHVPPSDPLDYLYTFHITPSGAGASSVRQQIMKDVAYRVVGDHIRTLTFAITDGATPSNEGRGYVLRRILRRAVRYGRQYLGTSKPFLCELVPAVAEAMGAAFPELHKAHGGRNVQHVAAIIRDEETSFGRTLDRGIALFNEAAARARAASAGCIAGDDAFRLHDTYGFPIDLTELMAREQGLTVDMAEYERLMEEAKDKARGGKAAAISQVTGIPEEFLDGETEDRSKYDMLSLHSKYLYTLSLSADEAHGRMAFVCERTCFYAEQGGQVGDIGWVEFPQGRFPIISTIRIGKQVAHEFSASESAKSLQENLIYGQEVVLKVDETSRLRTTRNHTSTHLLNWALREVLSDGPEDDHVQQKGSLVDPDKTRFDFSHPAALSEAEIERVEKLVNEKIAADLPVDTNGNVEVDQKAALKINGLRAVFGEKYPDRVRVVSIGAKVADLLADPANPKWRQFSVEFCGGTHLKRTGEAKRFRLVEESAVAKGIRRLVGVTADRADAADLAAANFERELQALRSRLDADGAAALTDFAARFDAAELPVLKRPALRRALDELQENVKQQQKAQSKSDAASLISRGDELLAAAPRAGGAALLAAALGSASVDQLRAVADSIRAKAGSAALLLAAEHEGKAVLLAATTPDVAQRGVKAGDLIKEIAPVVGGKGGGRPDMAQGGGPDAARIPDAVAAASAWLAARIK